MPVEYLDASIANEGHSADTYAPWMVSAAMGDEEYQPDIEPPHINDYAAFKKHKHYRQYFRPHRYVAFPAWMYHKTLDAKIVKTKEEALALGQEWSPIPNKPRVDMTGKSLPIKSETTKLAELVAQGLAGRQSSGPIDATAIAAIVAAVMTAMGPSAAPASAVAAPDVDKLLPTAQEGLRTFLETPEEERLNFDLSIERKALIELAEKDGVKIDKRWSNDRIKKELGLPETIAA